MQTKVKIGNKYNMLTVISQLPSYKGLSVWECLCDCGNKCSVYGTYLTNEHTKSCGCLKVNDLTGQQFGMLTVTGKASYKIRGTKKRTAYTCKCDCGNVAEIYADCLTSGMTTSCGCKHTSKPLPTVLLDAKCFGTDLNKIKCQPSKSNKSGIVGVNWDKSRGKWQASIKFKGHKYNLGRFEHIQDAIDARRAAEKEIFDSFLDWYNEYTKSNQKKGE